MAPLWPPSHSISPYLTSKSLSWPRSPLPQAAASPPSLPLTPSPRLILLLAVLSQERPLAPCICCGFLCLEHFPGYLQGSSPHHSGLSPPPLPQNFKWAPSLFAFPHYIQPLLTNDIIYLCLLLSVSCQDSDFCLVCFLLYLQGLE